MDEDQYPSQIGPPQSGEGRRRIAGDRLRALRKAFATREGLLGAYDYAYLFTPSIPFVRRRHRLVSPFFGLNDRLPVVLALLLGLQHSLAMLAGIITPPLIIANSANLSTRQTQYLVSTALIVSGLLSMIQIARFRIFKTPYYLGTGLLSVVGISFAIIPAATGALSQMYDSGFCPSDSATGSPLACPDGYGAILGTAAVCALLEVLISFLPPRLLLRIFPPIVTGPTVMLIGVSLIRSGFQDWAGGAGPCSDASPAAFFALCPNVGAPHALPWGSAEFLGLGFSVFATIVLCERFGAPLMKSCSVAIGLLAGCVISVATGYFDRTGIDAAPAASFVWTHTFRLSVYGPLVLPMLAVFVICACEAVGDITATCDVSRLEVSGPVYESRIQGGVLADGLNGVLAALATVTPVTTFAQNNGVIALTRCANRTAGYVCCIFLLVMGVFAKFAAAIVAIPSAVLGGMTTFLFCSVAVSGMAIMARGVRFTRRSRFVLTAALALGYGATLVPTYFDRFFTYSGANSTLAGLLSAVELVMETGFAVTAAVAIVLNLALAEEVEDGDGDGVEEEGAVVAVAVADSRQEGLPGTHSATGGQHAVTRPMGGVESKELATGSRADSRGPEGEEVGPVTSAEGA